MNYELKEPVNIFFFIYADFPLDTIFQI
jgi:hypothetical protein